MAEEKKRRGRRAYLADFHQTADGTYRYGGAMHRFTGPGSWKGALVRLWALTALMAAAAVTAGCVSAPGTAETVYVLLPLVLSCVCALSVVWLMARLTLGGPELRDYVYTATVGRVKVRGWATALFAAIALVGETVYLCLHGAGDRLTGAVVMVAALVTELGTVAGWTGLAGRLSWSK